MKKTRPKEETYNKLTRQRQMLADMVLAKLEEGTQQWTAGWLTSRPPQSAVTGKPYRGMNALFLMLVANRERYTDYRWVTFKQMMDRDWTFKTDAEGNSVGKGKGVPIEFFELIDKRTGERFNREDLDGMTKDEQEEYIQKNVYPLRKSYFVFNGDLIEGIPALEKYEHDPNERVERAEQLIEYWNANESQIFYGGHEAYYSPTTDTICVPKREQFETLQTFYLTLLHEIGHSTGHSSRLNREMDVNRRSDSYAIEELRAEFASIFLAQDLEIPISSRLDNNSAYIDGWRKKIKADPNVLFTAIADADKISKYIFSKEKTQEKAFEPYAIIADENEFGETEYKLYMIADNGQVRIYYLSETKEELLNHIEKLNTSSFWTDREFKEVGMEELEEMSLTRAETEKWKTEKSKEIYRPPSEIVARAMPQGKVTDMSDRGENVLRRMSDREVLERAKKLNGAETFIRLYNGENVLGSEEKNERSLMSRIAMYCDGDKERLMRLFQSSGQYRDEKPNSYYGKIADDAILFISKIKSDFYIEKPQARQKKGERKANIK